jgi:hypothetical protein
MKKSSVAVTAPETPETPEVASCLIRRLPWKLEVRSRALALRVMSVERGLGAGAQTTTSKKARRLSRAGFSTFPRLVPER